MVALRMDAVAIRIKEVGGRRAVACAIYGVARIAGEVATQPTGASSYYTITGGAAEYSCWGGVTLSIDAVGVITAEIAAETRVGLPTDTISARTCARNACKARSSDAKSIWIQAPHARLVGTAGNTDDARASAGQAKYSPHGSILLSSYSDTSGACSIVVPTDSIGVFA